MPLRELSASGQGISTSSERSAGASTLAHSHLVNPAAAGSTNVEVPAAPAQQESTPKRTQLSLPALAQRSKGPALTLLPQEPQLEAGTRLKSDVQAACRANHAKVPSEIQAAAEQKPRPPLRTGLEAPSYPCYTEVLRRARLRPERATDQQQHLAKKKMRRPHVAAKGPSGQPNQAKQLQKSAVPAADAGGNLYANSES